MQIFELHFNPKSSEDKTFESFCYEPENDYEKRLGSLYMVGELKNLLPQNSKFLNRLAEVIKDEYYNLSFKSPEQAIKASLKRANDFLSSEVKRENVSWLGNLAFGIISIKDLDLNFTKVGDLKILLSRDGQVIDIGERQEFQEIEPYPLKVFSHIISGRLSENDRISALNKGLYGKFAEKNLVQKMAEESLLSEKKIKEILKSEEDFLLPARGVCLISELHLRPQAKSAILFQKELEKFNLSKNFKKVLAAVKNINLFSFLKKTRTDKQPGQDKSEKTQKEESAQKEIRFPKFSLPKPVFPRISLPKINSDSFKNLTSVFAKNFISIILLASLLLAGFFIFHQEKEKSIKEAQDILIKVESEISQAEKSINLNENEKANDILQESWKEISPQAEKNAPLEEEALLLKKSIEDKLLSLNNLTIIENPDLLYEFNQSETNIVPGNVTYLQGQLYFSNPSSSNLYQFNPKNKSGKLWNYDKNLKLASVAKGKIIFLSQSEDKKPVLTIFSSGIWQEKMIQTPETGFSFDNMAGFGLNVYFLDKKTGEIVKYSLANMNNSMPLIGTIWLNSKTKMPQPLSEGNPLAIDGSLWIINKDKGIDSYYMGELKENLKLSLFPFLQSPAKILAGQDNSFLWLLEPSQKRIVILNKSGKIVRQYQSNKFDNLMDFAVSSDGKTIWILNGLKIYQIDSNA